MSQIFQKEKRIIFQAGDTKLERFLPKNQHTQRKLLNCEFWINNELSKIIRIILNFFFIEEYQFSNHFLKWCPIFDTFLLTQFSQFNNFLWVCWFLCKNLSNFVYPVWKLHNPYCHNHQNNTISWSLFLKSLDFYKKYFMMMKIIFNSNQ